MDKKYRICKLDGCDVWRVEHFAIPRWPFRLWMAPRWRPVYESSILAFDCPPRPVERRTMMDAVVTVERYEAVDREREARRRSVWDCAW